MRIPTKVLNLIPAIVAFALGDKRAAKIAECFQKLELIRKVRKDNYGTGKHGASRRYRGRNMGTNPSKFSREALRCSSSWFALAGGAKGFDRIYNSHYWTLRRNKVRHAATRFA